MKVLARMLPCAAAATFAFAPGPALAQTYPARPIHVIVPSLPGTLDAYVRVMTPMLHQITGQSLIIQEETT
ncbi:MAG: hypothetical protein IT514_09670 [Burkholderiales bacterium]|nr:hypothetical protein [Burkholderiales bacterium]